MAHAEGITIAKESQAVGPVPRLGCKANSRGKKELRSWKREPGWDAARHADSREKHELKINDKIKSRTRRGVRAKSKRRRRRLPLRRKAGESEPMLESIHLQLHRPNLAKLQPYLTLERKKLRPSWIDAGMRSIGVEQLNRAQRGHQIRVRGREGSCVQLAEGYVVNR